MTRRYRSGAFNEVPIAAASVLFWIVNGSPASYVKLYYSQCRPTPALLPENCNCSETGLLVGCRICHPQHPRIAASETPFTPWLLYCLPSISLAYAQGLSAREYDTITHEHLHMQMQTQC